MFEAIEQKVLCGKRLDKAEAEYLFRYPDLLRLGKLADTVREKLHGNATFFNRNIHLNYTNICRAQCAFCSFFAERGVSSHAYTLELNECLAFIEERYAPGIKEVHIVGGLNDELPFSYYTSLLRAIRSRFPELHIKAFSAVEIAHFAELSRCSYREVLEQLIDAGLGSLPGGGAEIFSARVRQQICPAKVDAEGWLAIHRQAHQLGLRSNCTMLYGTIETIAERVEHLLSLRSLQDEGGGFQAFVPLAYHAENNRLSLPSPPTAADDLRLIAASRLVLDNIPHIKAYWVMLGIKIAQIAQRFGADDLDGTVTEERVYHAAGATTPQSLSVLEIRRLISAIGRCPVERSSVYQVLDSSGSVHGPLDCSHGPVEKCEFEDVFRQSSHPINAERQS